MENFLFYLLRVSVSMALFYGFYKLFFGKNSFHDINRFLLIVIVLLTVLLPLFRFNLIPDWYRGSIDEKPPFDFSVFPVADISGVSVVRTSFPWTELLFGVFVVGFLFAVVRYLIGLFQIISIIRNSLKEKLSDGTTLCLSVKDIAPFSWMNAVVLPGKDISEENRAIIQHEQAHIHLKHSFDMILLDLFTSFFWFNPFSWLLRREIQSVHEYQADQQVLINGIDAKQYQLLLIRKCVGEQKFALANNFRQRDLHKRIQMMMKHKSDKQTKWSYAAAFPLLFLVMVALSIPKLNASIPEKAKDESIFVSENVRVQADTIHVGKVQEAPEKMEEVKVIRYGAMKEKNKISVFSVSEPGVTPLYFLDGKEIESISDLDPDQIASISVLKNNSSREIYGERGKDGVILITTKKAENAPFSLEREDKPLLIIDGVIQDIAFDLSSISPDEIQTMEVIKGKSAVELYGDEGKNGVILITRKQLTN